MEFLTSFFSSGSFIPHGHCYLWKPELVWLHIISDSLIAIAYYSIPLTLIYFVQKREDLPFDWIFLLFGTFIVSCGTTHIMEVWTLWHPTYWLSGFLKALTALVSVYTAIALVQIIPKALALPSPPQLEAANRQLQTEIVERKQAEASVVKLNAQLEQRVKQRTAELEAAYQLAQDSYNLLQTIIEATPDPIFVKNLQGYYLLMNSPGARLFNKSVEEIIGKDDSLLFPPKLCATVKANDRRIITSGKSEILEEAVIVQGEQRTYLSSKSVYRDSEGNILGLVGFAKDITHLKQVETALRDSEARLRQFIEDVPVAVAMFDSEMRYLATSRRWLTDYQLEENVIGRSHYEVFPNIPEYWKEVHQRCLAGVVEKCEEDTLLRADGTMDWLRWEIHPWRNSAACAGNVCGIILFTEIINDRKQAQQQLQKAKEDLERRVEERTADLKQANEQLRGLEADLRQALAQEKELSELKSRIITTISHEYRTPLTTIASSAELLEVYRHKWDEAKQLKHFQRIQAKVKHMTALVNDVLFINNVEFEKLEFNPALMNLVSFFGEILDELQPSISDKHSLTFTHKGNCTQAYFDEKLLRQILTNLLSNAIKYSPDGGKVQVRLTCEDNEVIFQVQDEGIGIPDTEQQNLFESFHRASNVGTIPGTGLGLAIVKKSVELHGGQIAVKSVVGVGTTFTVILPVERAVRGDRETA